MSNLIENADFDKLIESVIGTTPRAKLLTTIFDNGYIQILEAVEVEHEWEYIQKLIFKIGDQHYSVPSQYNSDGGRRYLWDDVQKVTAKTKEVVYYE